MGGYALGAADYLVKPVDRVKLVETLTGICGSTAGHAPDWLRARRPCLENPNMVTHGLRLARA